MNIWLNTIITFMMSFLLGGCVIPVPAGGEEPYTEVSTDLAVDNTTKADVLRRLGEPAATYSQGSRYVFTEYKKNWDISYLFELWPGGMGRTTSGEHHFLLMDFDEQDILTNLQIDNAGDIPGCSETGICHDGAGHVVQLASKMEEANAKDFAISKNQCGTFLYSDKFRNTRQTTVTLDSEYQGYVGQWGIRPFFYWQLNPGKHKITYHPGPGTLSFTCREGQLIFVLLTMEDELPLSLEVVDDSEGRRQINSSGLVFPKRKLIIPESRR